MRGRDRVYLERTVLGVGVTKAPFVNFSTSKNFDMAKVPLRLFESSVYLTGAPAAELRRHLSNINVVFNSLRVFWQRWKIQKITKRRKLVEGIDTKFEVMAVTPQTPKYHHNRGVAEVVVTFGSLWCHSHDRKRGINFYSITVPQN